MAGVLWASLFAGSAWAQVSGSAAVVSDYRYRGGSLSDGAPSAQLVLAWDHSDGWYAGTQLARVHFGYPGAEAEAQLLSWFGYVHPLHTGLNAEAGVQYSWFSRTPGYDYPEAYVGLGGERLRARIAYTPRYFGRGAAWYGELDGNRPLRGRLRAIAHIGALHVGAREEYPRPYRQRWRADGAVGLGWAAAGFDLQASWTTTSHDGEERCSPWQCGSGSGWILRLARNW